MEKYQSEFVVIKKLLQENPEGLSIQDFAEMLGMNRITVSKYLDILQIQGQVDAKRVGTSKVYVNAHRLPASSIRKVCPFMHVLVDKNQVITGVHEDFLHYFRAREDDYVGRRIDQLPPDLLKDERLQAAVKGAIRGKESSVEMGITVDRKERTFKISCLPVVFENAKPGMTLLFEDLTATRESGRLLQQMEARYQALIEDQVGYIIRFLPDGTITYVNDTYCRDAGREKEALIGSVYHPFIPEEDREKVRKHFAALSKENPVEIIEHRAIMANGQVRWQRWKDRALFDDRGSVTEYHSVGIDITDFKHAQEKLRTSYEHLEDLIEMRTQELQDTNRQLYREIAQREAAERNLNLTQFAMDNSADMVIWFDESGRIIYANHSTTTALGYPQETLSSMQWQDLSAPNALVEWDRIWKICKENAHSMMEMVISRNDREKIPVDIHFNHLRFNSHEYCCAFFRDITERTRFIKAIEESREQIQNFLQNLPVGLYRKDPAGMVIFANPYMQKILGCPREVDLSSFNLDGLYLKPEIRADMAARILQHGLIENEEVELKRRNEETFWARISEIGVRHPDNSLKYIDGVIEDITEKKEAEEGLKNAQSTLKFLNRVTLKEIRNELFILSGYLDLASDSADERVKGFLEKIERSAAHIRVNLDFGDRYQNIGGSSPVWLRLYDAFLFAISHLPLEDINVKVNLGGYKIWADPHFEMVFTILVENSLMYGKGVRDICICAEEIGRSLRVQYTDDGCGIPREHKQAIFERDYNPEAAPRMYLVKEILSITGITIEESGEPGKGVSFVMEIPRFRSTADPLDGKSPSASSLAEH